MSVTKATKTESLDPYVRREALRRIKAALLDVTPLLDNRADAKHSKESLRTAEDYAGECLDAYLVLIEQSAATEVPR